ncbi:hypothetical protein HN358_05045 [Candidatus Uhrbacteria bacterium]|jgi:hypothetical protein|nr:hypothetical protein [Candidatus Uhrbacteria bacterium]MBT7716769.1 hypothetical protein [Candidatus Uhrbacteria bacterium]
MCNDTTQTDGVSELELWQHPDPFVAGLPAWQLDLMADIPSGMCDWEVHVKRYPDGSVGRACFVLVSPEKTIYRRVDLVDLGGYAGILYREPGGGGPALLLYTKSPSGEIYVGLLRRRQVAMGGYMELVAGGTYWRPEMSREDSAVTAAQAELAQCAGGGEDNCPIPVIFELPGTTGMCMNRGFVAANVRIGEGVGSLVANVDWDHLDGTGEGGFKFRLSFDVEEGLPGVQGARDIIFIPIDVAGYLCGDPMAVTIMQRLRAHLTVPDILFRVEQYRHLFEQADE